MPSSNAVGRCVEIWSEKTAGRQTDKSITVWDEEVVEPLAAAASELEVAMGLTQTADNPFKVMA